MRGTAQRSVDLRVDLERPPVLDGLLPEGETVTDEVDLVPLILPVFARLVPVLVALDHVGLVLEAGRERLAVRCPLEELQLVLLGGRPCQNSVVAEEVHLVLNLGCGMPLAIPLVDPVDWESD